MAIYELDGIAPELPADNRYFIADTAAVIGRVRLHNDVSVWFGSVLRGDNEQIEIGEGSNVQENCTFHTDPSFPLTIGKNCTIGHNVILHGCTIEDGALIGMGAIVMNGARIGKGCVVGAGAVVPEGKQYEDRSLVIGAPARVVRALTPEQVAALTGGAAHYVHNGKRFRAGLKKIG
jgi:carbonic anhydrase/acetyltransferase-like protein (isoleucine patch superfamily)